MSEPAVSSSATAPVIGAVFGLLLIAVGGIFVATIGWLLFMASGLLLAVRLVALLLRSSSGKTKE